MLEDCSIEAVRVRHINHKDYYYSFLGAYTYMVTHSVSLALCDLKIYPLGKGRPANFGYYRELMIILIRMGVIITAMIITLMMIIN